MLQQIITHTPYYVWIIFIYVLYIGWYATQPRIIWIPKLFLMPLFLIVSKYYAITDTNFIHTLLAWIIGLIIGIFTGLKDQKITFLIEQNAIKLPGGYITLIFCIILFGIKYSLGLLKATNFALFNEYKHIDTLVICLFSSYSLNKAIMYTSRFLYYRNHIRK